MNRNLIWLLSKYIHRKDWITFLKLNISFYKVGSLLSSGIDPSIYANYVIRCAAQNGHEKVVELFLQDPRVDPSAQYDLAIRYAAWFEYAKVIELLLQDPRVDPTIENNFALRYSVKNGHAKVIELLLQDSRVELPDAVDEKMEEDFYLKILEYNDL